MYSHFQVYYAAFAIIFQFGWASTQISHLATIPDISSSQNERTGLTAIRYSMTVASNILVYSCAWGLLNKSDGEGMIGPEDEAAFRTLMQICLGVGILTFACGGSALVGVCGVLSLLKTKVGTRTQAEHNELSEERTPLL